MTHESGSESWLRNKAWFSCEHCEADNEPTVHRVADLKILDGKTICRECWDNIIAVPDKWSDLNTFDPFIVLNEQKAACCAVLYSLEKLAADGEIIWLDPPHVLPGVHESAIERLKAVME